jgi:hypothetical protein
MELFFMKRNSQRIVFLSLIVILSGVLTACGGNSAAASDTGDLKMAEMSGMPADVKSAPTTVQQAYQFAVANPDVMKQIACYCGCGNMGHTSNYSCYVENADAQGTITYDTHALGCSICVDITQDAMRYLGQGKTGSEIQALIDQTYAKYGPSNLP